MLYEKYKTKVDKFMRVIAYIIKIRWLFIGLGILCVVLSSAYLSVKGSITGDELLYTEYTYGDTIEYSANALFSKVGYMYRSVDGGEWTTVMPKKAGRYQVRAVTQNAFGKDKYGVVREFTISPKKLEVLLEKSSGIYGELPTVKADLIKGDNIENFSFGYGEIKDGKTTLDIDTSSFLVKNDNGEDVSAQYLFTFEKTDFTLLKRPVTFTSSDKTFVFDNTVKQFNEYSITDGSLASDDVAEVTFEGFITFVGDKENSFGVVIKNEDGRDVSELYEITREYGTLSVTALKVEIFGKDAYYTYDGKTHSGGEFDLSADTPIADGHEIKLIGSTEVVNSGEYVNEIRLGIFDADGNDVTYCYDQDIQFGKIVINKKEILIGTKSNSFMYDGNVHYEEGCEDIDSALIDGHVFSVIEKTGIIDVSESGKENVLEVGILYGNENVTENYDITYEYGTLTVTERPITVVTESKEFIYNGEEQYCEEHTIVGEYGPVDEHKTIVVSNTKVKNIADSGAENKLVIEIFNGEENETANYAIAYEYGILTVKQREITVTTASDEKIYDGTPLTNAKFDSKVQENGGLVAEQILNVAVIGTITDVGSTSNIADESLTAITDKDGNDVTHNYDISYEYGTLTVTPRAITITTESDEKIYDGTPLVNLSYGFKVQENGGLVAGQILNVTVIGTITDVGSTLNIVDERLTAITDKSGNDVTHNYDISYEYGTLTVTPRAITITTAADGKIYDGTPLTNAKFGFKVQENGGLVDGHILNVAVIGTITDAGSVLNIADETQTAIIDKSGNDVTFNYDISYEYGTLTVTERPITVVTESKKFVYNGDKQYCEEFKIVGEYGLVGWHSVVVASNTKVKNVADSGVKNKLVLEIFNGEENVTANYAIAYEYGILTVLQREITVVTASKEFIYNGDKQYCEEFTIAGEHGIVGWHSVVVASNTKVKNVADSGAENKLVIEIFSGEENVTANYAIAYEYGILTVKQRKITVTTATDAKIYDGTPLTNAKYGFRVQENGGLVAGHNLFVTVTGTITDAGSTLNTADESLTAIKDKDGNDVTVNYAITYEYGTLVVKPRPVTVVTGSAEKWYDGEPLVNNKYDTVAPQKNSGLIEGHTLYVCVTGIGVNAGEYPNTVDEAQTVISDEAGRNVTSNYDITYKLGILKIKRRPITFATGSDKKVYDKKPLTNGDYRLTSTNGLVPILADGHHAEYKRIKDITDVGVVKNEVAVFIKDSSGDDFTANYDITYEFGTLEITPVIIHYSTQSASKVFDGIPLKGKGEYDAAALIDGDKATIEFISILWGKATNDISVVKNVKQYVITDKHGKTVNQSNYEFKSTELGTLEVLPKEIVVSTGSAEKFYDGEPLLCEEYEIENNGLCNGHSVKSAIFFAGAIKPGEYENTVVLSIFDKGGIDVTEGYEIICNPGILTVKKAIIYVKTGSAKKVYDKKPLTCNEWDKDIKVDGKMTDNIAIAKNITGTITEIGSTPNVGTGWVIDLDTKKESDCYELVVVGYGTLTVTTGSTLDDSGNIGGGGSDGDGSGGSGGSGGSPLMLELFADVTKTIYLRFKSFGDYTGKGWNEAIDYDKTIEGFAYNYLIGLILNSSGIKNSELHIKSYSNYVLPYYPSLSGEYESQKSDVIFNGKVGGEYWLEYYLFDYVKDYPDLTVNQLYGAIEEEYYKFVCEKYLSVPDSTREYMAKLINDKRWGTSYADIVAIAKYVQNAATYNLKYDASLDKEADIAVSFLDKYKEGVCRHYASAATLIYRTLGIPARYTIGFVGDAKSGEWVDVTGDKAHAWVEIYIKGLGWVMIEVTGSGNGSPVGGGGSGGSGGSGGGSGGSGGGSGGSGGGSGGSGGGSGGSGGGSGDGSGDGSGGDQGDSIIDEIEELIIKPVDVDKVYDGTPLVAKNEAETNKNLAKLLAAGYTYNIVVQGSRTDYGVSESTILSFSLFDKNKVDVTDKLKIKFEHGKITITEEQIHVYLTEKKKVYDGTPLFYDAGDYYVRNLPDGYDLEFDITNPAISITNVGKLDVSILQKYITVFDSFGNDVTKSFYIKFIGDGLTVEKRELSVHLDVKRKTYDGTPLTYDEGEYFVENLLDGFTFIFDITNPAISVTNVGKLDLSILPKYIRIIDLSGNDVTANFAIKFMGDGLTVEKREIVVRTNSAEKEYCEKILESQIAWIGVGKLADGHRFIAEDWAWIFEKGEADNSCTVRILDSGENDVTSNYEITYKFGKLKIT